MKGLNRKIGQRVALACAMLLLCHAFAGIEDKVLRFSTPGVDCYADGSPVVDGECYALVWSPKGTVFSGFNADGTAASTNDRVVLAAALAKGGRCRDALFQVPAEEYAELEGGEWAVCLVDTRKADGVPAGVKDNAPLRVNRWGTVDVGVQVESAEKLKPAASAPNGATGFRAMSLGDEGACAGNLSSVPDSVKPPRITGFSVADSGEVTLEVEDTVPFLSYTIISGSEPGDLQADSCSEIVDGKDGEKIAIGTAQSSDSRFFRVKRAE